MQIGWPTLPLVSMTLLAARDLHERGYLLESVSCSPSTSVAWEKFHTQIHAGVPDGQQWAPPSTTSPSAPLQEHVIRVHRGFDAARGGLGLTEEGLRVADTLINVDHQSICATCSVSVWASAICQWSPDSVDSDEITLASKGACLRPLRDLFYECQVFLVNVTFACGLEPTKSVHAVGVNSGRASAFNNTTELAIAGKVTEESSGYREVRIDFFPKAFDLGDYLALPYVILHEFAAHAICGVGLRAADATRSVSFHDGWMDRIVVWLLQQKSAAFEKFPALGWSEFSERARVVHAKRNDAFKVNRSVEVANYLAGCVALEVFSDLMLEALQKPDDEPETSRDELVYWVIKASLDIVSSNVSHLQRRDLVDSLSAFHCNHASRRLQHYRSSEGVAAVKCIKDYIADPDAGRLVSGLVATLG